jgi:hypothetical protein
MTTVILNADGKLSSTESEACSQEDQTAVSGTNTDGTSIEGHGIVGHSGISVEVLL